VHDDIADAGAEPPEDAIDGDRLNQGVGAYPY
jgi:hypothetical protein